MTILMSADTVGGVWTYAVDLIRALHQLDANIVVHLATLGDVPNDAQRAQIASLPNASLHESRYKLEWMPDPWDDVRASGDWLLHLERELRPDIVHLNGFAHGQRSFRAPVLVVAHSDVYSWFHAVHLTFPPREWNRYHEEVSAGLRWADIVVAPTQAALEDTKSKYTFKTPTRRLFNGRDALATAPQAKEPFIFAAGRLWDEAKNLKLLDMVAPRLPWPVLVAGSTSKPNGETVEAANVTLLGYRSEAELRDLMARASIYCLPAKYEPFGLSILEAAQNECALVLGNIPSLRELWDTTADGLGASSQWAQFVSSRDAAHLEQLLLELIAKPELRASFGRKARHRAQAFTAQRMARRYRALYRELIASRREQLRAKA